MPEGMSLEELEAIKSKRKVDLGYAGSIVEWKTDHGIIREEILKYGLHDVVMGNPIITLAVMRIFDDTRRDRIGIDDVSASTLMSRIPIRVFRVDMTRSRKSKLHSVIRY